MFRGNARVNAGFVYCFVKSDIVVVSRKKFVEIVTGECVLVFANNSKISRNTRRSERVVASNHNSADSSAVSLSNTISNLNTRRVNNANHAVPNQIGFQHVALLSDISNLTGSIRNHAVNLCQAIHAKRTIRHAKSSVSFSGKAFDGS